MGFFQGWPTHLSVSNVNLAPTVQNLDLPAVLPALHRLIPTKVPLFAFNVTKTNIQVCIFTFVKPNISLNLQHYCCSKSKLCICYRHKHTWERCMHHAPCFRFVLSLDFNVSCVLLLIPARCFFPDLIHFFFQRLVQGAANQDLRVQTVTTSTPTLPVTLTDR